MWGDLVVHKTERLNQNQGNHNKDSKNEQLARIRIGRTPGGTLQVPSEAAAHVMRAKLDGAQNPRMWQALNDALAADWDYRYLPPGASDVPLEVPENLDRRLSPLYRQLVRMDPMQLPRRLLAEILDNTTMLRPSPLITLPALPHGPGSAAPAALANPLDTSDTPRSQILRDRAHHRDKNSCVITGNMINDVAHIFPSWYCKKIFQHGTSFL